MAPAATTSASTGAMMAGSGDRYTQGKDAKSLAVWPVAVRDGDVYLKAGAQS